MTGLRQLNEEIMTELKPEYNIVTDCREPTIEELEIGFDNLLDLVRRRQAENEKLKVKLRFLEGRLKCCRDERDDYQAVSVRLLGELKAAQDGEGYAPGRIVSADDWQDPEAWRQQE